ncbi:MAG: hypothetical protein GYB39_00790 [Algicola sp.]|nr:hypothetical protein [Algicola sp.]
MHYVILPKKTYFIILFVIVALFSCNTNKKESKSNNDTAPVKEKKAIVEVTTHVMDFQMPSQLKSGWTTFKYHNKSEETHFFIFEKMPEGITLENYNNELVPPFKAAFSHLINNDVEKAMKELEKTPAWWSDVKMSGGVGLLSPKSSAQTTIYLQPGTYVIECYVRMPDGMPHTFHGMLKEITVTADKNTNPEPLADYKIAISSETGISSPDSIKTGQHRFAVHYKDQKQYETMLGHDVNLVKLDHLSLLDTLSHWVNTTNIKAFRSPAPKGLTFLGGVEDMEAGETGYFMSELDKGNYVLISEIPKAIERNMFKVFKVY